MFSTRLFELPSQSPSEIVDVNDGKYDWVGGGHPPPSPPPLSVGLWVSLIGLGGRESVSGKTPGKSSDTTPEKVKHKINEIKAKLML